MNTPEAHSLTVVKDDNKNKFLLPDGSLVLNVLADAYSSHKPYSPPNIYGLTKEVDTPFLVFRDGQYYDSGRLDRIFGSDGYYVVSGLKRIQCPGGTFLYARHFEVGDVITFVRIPYRKP